MLRAAAKLLQWQQAKPSGWVTGRMTGGASAAATTTSFNAQTSTNTTAARSERDHWSGATDFVLRASSFKKRMRSKAQYAFGREEAQRFLDAEVPKANLSTWMDDGSNAISLVQVLQLFEIQPEASVASLLLNRLLRFADDSGESIKSRGFAVLGLLYLRPEENYERAFQVLAQMLQQLQRSAPAAPVPGDVNAMLDAWHSLGICAKVLQRCGKRVPPSLNDELARAIMAQLQVTPQEQFYRVQSELLRFYSWMVRAERPEANQVLFVLVEKTGEFSKSNFPTLLLSCVRHNQLVPLPIELVERLTRVAPSYGGTCNGREAGAILGSLAKLLHTFTPNVNGVTTADLYRVHDYFAAVLEDYSDRVERFLQPGNKHFWSTAEDVSSAVFAYELGGHTRYHRIFAAYGVYVQHCVQNFEPPQLALAAGILRRSQLLTAELAARISERIEVVLGELRLAELSHICATFAVLPGPKPSWWAEAKAVALRLDTPDASGVVRLNLAIAFPDEPNLADTVDYAQITSKQLVDLVPITLGSAQFEEAVVATLCGRLASPAERFSPDDLRVLLTCNRPPLLQAAQEHLRRVFAEPQWNTDTLFSLPLVCDPHHPERNMQTFSAAKALAAAKAAAVGSQQFVSLADLLLSTFGDTDAAICAFVQSGGEDLVQKSRSVEPLMRYLAVVRRYPSLTLSTAWLHSLTDRFAAYVTPIPPAQFEDFLLSLRSLYEDVAKTPALQTLLSHLVDATYGTLAEADELTARITVLLVYLQSGMTLPLLTAQHPVLAKVVANDAAYSPQVRKALAMMPLPKSAPAEERRGRFVLKHLAKSKPRPDDAVSFALDLNTSDPFEIPFDAEADAPAAAPAAAVEMPTPSATASTPVAAAARPAAAAATPAPDPYRPPPPTSPSPTVTATATATAVQGTASSDAAAPTTTTTPTQEEKHMSYYAKFFSSSVGQIFTGRGVHDNDNAHKSDKEDQASAGGTAASAATVPAGTAPPQPRRTRLHPSHTAPSGAAAAASSPSATPVSAADPAAVPAPQPAPPATPAVPVTSFTTAWGTAPSSAPAMAGWGFAANPSASTNASASGAGDHTHNTAFRSLFGGASTDASTSVHQQQQQQQQQQASSTPSAASSASPPRPAALGGNNVFFDPSSPRASAAAPRSRPVISRKAVITRQGAASHHGSNSNHNSGAGVSPTMTAEQEDIRRIYNDPAQATELHGGVGAAGGPQIVLDTTSADTAPASSFGQRGNSNHFNNNSNNGSSGLHVNSNPSGMAQFMQKTGVTKITGYNMDGEAASGAAAAAAEQATSEAATAPLGGTGATPPTHAGEGNRPALDWMDAARRVARVTRHPRTKVKSRTHNSLSAWLNTPSARLDAAADESGDVSANAAAQTAAAGAAPTAAAASTAAASASESTAKAGGARQTTVAAALHRKRTKKDKAAAAAEKAAAKLAAAAEAAEAEATSTNGKRGGRGKGGKAPAAPKAAKAGKPPKAAAGGAAAGKKKNAAPAKKPAAAKPAATKAAGGGRAKKAGAAAAPAAKPAVKSAKKAVKAAAKKAAPAKKKQAAGKGKKK